MANTRSGSVLVFDTTAAITETLRIKAIKYVPLGTTPAAAIRADSASGIVVWEESGDVNVHNQVCMMLKAGAHITLVGAGTKLYIYLDI